MQFPTNLPPPPSSCLRCGSVSHPRVSLQSHYRSSKIPPHQFRPKTSGHRHSHSMCLLVIFHESVLRFRTFCSHIAYIDPQPAAGPSLAGPAPGCLNEPLSCRETTALPSQYDFFLVLRKSQHNQTQSAASINISKLHPQPKDGIAHRPAPTWPIPTGRSHSSHGG
jgi:hypothetical protein